MTTKKRKPKYLKILQGMNCCYGSDDRKCADCPYDRYNDRDFYGMGTAYCMEKLNEDAKKWTESMTAFTACGECVCWRKNIGEDGLWDEPRFKNEGGLCTQWNVITDINEFCSRGAMRE